MIETSVDSGRGRPPFQLPLVARNSDQEAMRLSAQAPSSQQQRVPCVAPGLNQPQPASQRHTSAIVDVPLQRAHPPPPHAAAHSTQKRLREQPALNDCAVHPLPPRAPHTHTHHHSPTQSTTPTHRSQDSSIFCRRPSVALHRLDLKEDLDTLKRCDARLRRHSAPRSRQRGAEPMRHRVAPILRLR